MLNLFIKLPVFILFTLLLSHCGAGGEKVGKLGSEIVNKTPETTTTITIPVGTTTTQEPNYSDSSVTSITSSTQPVGSGSTSTIPDSSAEDEESVIDSTTTTTTTPIPTPLTIQGLGALCICHHDQGRPNQARTLISNPQAMKAHSRHPQDHAVPCN